MTELPEPSPGLHGDHAAAATPQALVDRRELSFIAVERTRMPMVITDPRQPDNPIVLANSAFLTLTGYEPDEVIGRNCRFLQGKGTSSLTVREIAASLAEQREVNVELLNYRKDGSAFWNQLHISPIHDDDGRLLYYFASQLDATEQRRVETLEAAEHRLLKEVDHRALNVLSIVEGIVRLSRADDAAQYSASVQRRVQALARAHTLLSENGWKGAALDRVIRTQVEPFAGGRVEIEGPPTELGATQVQPLALVLHELATNAVNHGALSTASGIVGVRWSRDAGARRVAMHWVESGGPAPSSVRSPGFGVTMTKAIVERQLHGELNRTWDPTGLKAEVSFPLEQAGR